MPQKTPLFFFLLCIFLSCQPKQSEIEISPCTQELAYARTVPEDEQCLAIENFSGALKSIALSVDSVMNGLSQTLDWDFTFNQLAKFPPEEAYLLQAKAYRQYSDELMVFTQTIQGVKAIEKAKTLMDNHQKNSRCDSIEMAEILNRMGIAYEKKADVERCLLANQRALDLNRKLGRLQDIAIDFTNMAIPYCMKGDLLEANHVIQQALCISDHLGIQQNNEIRLAAINNQAVIFSYEMAQNKKIGQIELAKAAGRKTINTLLPVNDSLWVQLEKNNDFSMLLPLAFANLNIAKGYQTLDNPIYADSIQVHLHRVLQKIGEVYDGAIPRTFQYLLYPMLAYAQIQKGNTEAGLDTVEMGLTALILNKKNVDKTEELNKEDLLDEVMLIQVFYLKGLILEKIFKQKKDIERLKEAHQSYKNALKLIDRMRTDFASDPEIESFNQSFEIYVSAAALTAKQIYDLDSVKNKNYLKEALKIADEGKGNTLLQAAYRNLNKLVFNGSSKNLVIKENQFREHIREAKQNYMAATYRGDMNSRAAFQDILLAKQKEYRLFIEALKGSQDQEELLYYQSRFGQKLLPIEEIQQSLDPQTAIIEYELGIYDATAFIITASNLTAVPIIADSTFYDMIRQYSGQLEYDKKNYSPVAFALYEKLILPVENHLSGIENLIIIPDRELSTIAFGALLTQEVSYATPWKDHPYLINKYAISTYYSLAMLGNFSKYQELTPKNKSYFAAYTSAPENDKKTPKKNIDLACSQNAIPKVEDATKRIFNKHFYLDSPDGNYTSATEDQFKTTASDYKILQLTMHGCFDKDRDVLDNYLQFFEGEKEDGRLTVGEIYGLTLYADLAFLSNCNSGQGIYDQVEGLKGIARAFNYAGCKGVIAPLQNVKDAPTAKLIQLFYDFLEVERNPAQALAKAQRKYQQEEDTHPSEWANFIYIGTGSAIDR